MHLSHMPSSRQKEELAPSLSQAFKDLCAACRVGDADTVDSLLLIPDLDINQEDEWDYTPLILASLCGHLKVVELLLARGAVCDRDSFQGARCIYGALNDTIRNLLLSFDISKKVDTNQPFAGRITQLLNPLAEVLSNRDVVFVFPHIHGVLALNMRTFRFNRFVLAARSPYFLEKFGGAWRSKNVIEMPSSTNPVVFRAVMDYVYLRTDLLPIDQADLRRDFGDFCRKLKLTDLAESVQKVADISDQRDIAKYKRDMSFVFVEHARKQFESFFFDHVVGNRVVVPIEDDVDFDDIDVSGYLSAQHRRRLLDSTAFGDIVVSVIDVELDSIVYYPVHKAILARSEYFETMFRSDLFPNNLPRFESEVGDVVDRPSAMPDNLQIVQLATSCTSAQVAEIVLRFLYSDDVQLPLGLVIEVMFAADELFLERLKTMGAVRITTRFSNLTHDDLTLLVDEVGYDAYDLIKVAWQVRSERLEQHVTKLLAYNLREIFTTENAKLRLLISDSAQRIRERQVTDTIELVDDMRYFLSRKYALPEMSSDFEPLGPVMNAGAPEFDDHKAVKAAVLQYNRDIEIIDRLLDDLDLDA